MARALLLATSTLIVLGAIEIALRVVGFEYHLYPERIEFGWPDPETLASEFVPDERLLWVTPRYAERVDKARERRPNLVFMGDSCTALGSFDRAFARRMKQSGRTFRFANLAVSGWSTYQGREQLERDVVPIAPERITLFYGWNDHWVGFGLEDEQVASLNASPLYPLRNVRLVQLVARAWVGGRALGRERTPQRVSPADFRRNLEDMVALARAHDIEPVLLTAPTSHERGREPEYLAGRWLDSLDELIPLHQQYVGIVRDVARETGAPLCDLAASFAALPRDALAASFGGDGIHFTEAGSERVAELLFACFEEQSLL